MYRGFDIPWVGGQNTMGKGINIPSIGGVRYSMGLRVKIPWVGSDIPWIAGLICHG